MDPAFEGVGQTNGLQIWRIENFEVVAYPREKYGQFYEGDSYIVLYTTEVGCWDVYFWLGSATSQDESGACAIKAVELDDALGGVPLQHREVQGHESSLFLSRFKTGVRYLKGGVASGFTAVDPDAPRPPHLYHVKGRRNVRVTEVEPEFSSLNAADCFVLSAGHSVYAYMGPASRRVERLKAVMAAGQVRDDDHSGRAPVLIIDETASEDEVAAFLEAIGGGDLAEVAEVEGDDDTHEEEVQRATCLQRVWQEEEGGKVQVEEAGGAPLQQAMLKTEDCFLLDTGRGVVYAWIGRGASQGERGRATLLATQYIESKGYPRWTRVERVVEGAETTVFKAYFAEWSEPDESVGRVYSRGRVAAGSPDAPDAAPPSLQHARLLRKSGGPALGFMPDDGCGEVEVFRVEDFELVAVDPSAHGFFFGGDSYVVRYSYSQGGKQGYVVYFWQGTESSQDERAAAAIHAVRLDNELSGKAVQVRVTQGHEPGHFLRVFQGRLVTFSGGRASGFRNVHDCDSYDADGTRLFQVRGTCPQDVRAEQRAEVAASLSSLDVFVLETPAATFLWLGEGSTEAEAAMGEEVCTRVSPGRDVTTIKEGEEGDDFWAALGGQGGYSKAVSPSRPFLTPRLFHCAGSASGRIRCHEVATFAQEDLAEDDVMVLDSGDEVYVWVGEGASDEEKEKTWQLAQNYIAADPSPRTLAATVFVQVRQGQEPHAFRGCFPTWNPDMWQEQPSYDDVKTALRDTNAALE